MKLHWKQMQTDNQKAHTIQSLFFFWIYLQGLFPKEFSSLIRINKVNKVQQSNTNFILTSEETSL